MMNRKSLVKKYAKILQDFKKDICIPTMDPKEEFDWYSLSIGYFIAKGLNRDEAVELSLYVRYDKNYSL